MALKNWKKKVHEGAGDIFTLDSISYYSTKQNADLMIFIHKYMKGTYWYLSVDGGFEGEPNISIEKKYKTKPQALKFAKNYMKKH